MKTNLAVGTLLRCSVGTIWIIGIAFCLGQPIVAASNDYPLVDLKSPAGLIRLAATDAFFKPTGGTAGIAVITGHREPWPGIALRNPEHGWDLSRSAQIEVRLRNTDTNQLTVFCRVDNPGADGVSNCVTHSMVLQPGGAGLLRVGLNRTHQDDLGGKLFGMRGYPVASGGAGTIDPAHITQVLVFLSKPTEDHHFEILEMKATGVDTAPTAWTTDADPFFPFIDQFGQYRHKDWPGKVHSTDELRQRRLREASELKDQPGPKNWDPYGGAALGPQLRATGFFRTEKVAGKWWLVDPDGHLFFSHGVDCVGSLDSTPIEERENWFQDFPGKLPEYASFISTGFSLKGHYAGRSPQCFSFVGANLRTKYGPDWQKDYRAVVHQRLRSWGLNTIANWSDSAIRRVRGTPYTDSISSGRTREIAGSEGYWGKFPDVFDPDFTEHLRKSMAAKRADSAGDRWCIGFFSDNEMSWGDQISLSVGALQSPPDQPAKRALVNDLKDRYQSVESLNQAWGSTYASWDGLLQTRKAPDKTRAGKDLEAFYSRAAEQYFRSVRDAIKAIAPHQLYLGCRFAWVNPLAAAAAAKYCDVVSYNLYRTTVEDFQFNGGADVPLLIGEFHLGALDRGLFHPGLVPVANQSARAEAYKNYVRGALKHPQFVGCHWFQYFDEPTTGRSYDEENYQIGFLDIADTPYSETIAACREVGYHLYPPY
jgi:hypothetical protein